MSVRLLPVAFLLLALAIPASAQASFTGLYVQSFDDIGGAPNAELPEGWRVQTLPGIRSLTMRCRYPVAEVQYDIPGL